MHEPLDKIEPETPTPKPQRKFGLVIELLLGFGFLTGILFHDVLGFPRSYELALMIACLLGALYLFGNWWLNKPSHRSVRAVLITILFGLTSFALLFTIVFSVLYLPGEYEMRMLSLTLLVISLLIEIITSVNKVKVTNTRTRYRFILLTGIISLYAFIDEEKRIYFSYRKYPEFLKYYEEQKTSLPFYEIEKNYFGE